MDKEKSDRLGAILDKMARTTKEKHESDIRLSNREILVQKEKDINARLEDRLDDIQEEWLEEVNK